MVSLEHQPLDRSTSLSRTAVPVSAPEDPFAAIRGIAAACALGLLLWLLILAAVLLVLRHSN